MKPKIIFFAIVLAFSINVYAQCPNCDATVPRQLAILSSKLDTVWTGEYLHGNGTCSFTDATEDSCQSLTVITHPDANYIVVTDMESSSGKCWVDSVCYELGGTKKGD